MLSLSKCKTRFTAFCVFGVLFLFLTLPSTDTVCAQEPAIDNLRKDLQLKQHDTVNARICLKLAEEFSGLRKYDSALNYIQHSLELLSESKNTQLETDILKEYALLLKTTGNPSKALEYYYKILKILDSKKSGKKEESAIFDSYSEVYVMIGLCYMDMEYYDKALLYYRKSLDACREAYKLNKEFPLQQRQLVLYNNIGSIYLTRNNTDSAAINFMKAIEINRTIKNESFSASLFNNMGIIYKTRKIYDSAFYYYNKSLELRQQLNDTAGLAQVLNNLGDSYFLVNDLPRAIEILTLALEFSKKSGNLVSQMKAANFLTIAYEKSGNYKRSLDYQRFYDKIRDSLNSEEQLRKTANLELQYAFDKQMRENELRQEIKLINKQRKALIFMIISAVFCSLFIILFLFNRNKNIKLKQIKLVQESLELESRNLALEKRNLEMELDYRNKELATHVMYLLKKNEFIASVSERLINLKNKLSLTNTAGLQDIVREMKSNIDHTVWNEFEVRFQNVHQSFYDNLQTRFPDLTPNERKLCAFIRLNMTIKDIGAITYQSENSIRVARIRLRKKIGLERDENLIAFLQEL